MTVVKQTPSNHITKELVHLNILGTCGLNWCPPNHLGDLGSTCMVPLGLLHDTLFEGVCLTTVILASGASNLGCEVPAVDHFRLIVLIVLIRL